jgi:quinoprotein relay system zinc metallohydrolase 2
MARQAAFFRRLAGAVACLASHAALAQSPAPAWRQIAPGDFARPGLCAEATADNGDAIANTGFIVGDTAVAVIDPGGSLTDGANLHAAIRAVTKLPIRYVIMTHDHPDHVFGAAAFLPDRPIFAGHWHLQAGLTNRAAYDHTRLAAILGEAATGGAVAPTLTVKTTVTLDLGHRKLILQAWNTAHTNTDLTVLDQATATLWAGDLLFVGRVPALDGSLTGWIATLDLVTALPAQRAVPGHGPAAVPWPQAAAPERRYLAVLSRDVADAIAKGQDINQAVASAAASQRGQWALFDAYNGRNVTEAYKELQWN